MRKILLVTIILAVGIAGDAQDEPYRGGAADGHTKTEQVTPFTFPDNFSPFLGGANDGWAENSQQGIIILPLTLLQFRGEEINGMHKLIWQTEHEVNTSHFEIERSNSASGFNSLGQKTARRNFSGQAEYRFVDSLPLKGRNFYRLKMVDRDGHFKYSSIIVLEKKNGLLTMAIYPNPVKQILNVKLNRVVSGQVTCTVHDIAGRKIIQQFIQGNYGQYAVNVSSLPSGVYTLQVITENGTETIQFSKQ